tara:strand:+ start:313 stop:639 length:327 start_codon:yes stop_codon:yes gene_type:complete
LRVPIKPLSVNQAWQGRRFKSDAYKRYERDVLMLLRPMSIPEGYLSISLVFGFSSKSADFDNPVKPFVDCLQKKYRFNDRAIKRAEITVEEVKKGDEFIEFTIESLGA